MSRPLEGVRVIDMTRVMSGPFASLMLSDLGADVIKVEAEGIGDVMRHMGGHHRGGVNAIFSGLNRGKRSVTVDLRSEQGRDTVRRLAIDADVFIENFRPGVCDAIGLGAADLQASNAALVYASINGYGDASPATGDPAYDTMVQGRSGMVARQRRGTTGEPDIVRSFLVDKVAGFFAVQGVLAALLDRQRSGRGRRVCVPMMDAALYYLWPDSMTDQAFVGDNVRPGTIFPLAVGLTRTADGYLTHMALSDKERAGVNRAIGRPELSADPRFATTAESNRPENLRDYQKAVRDGFLALTTDEALARLRAEGVPCSAVREAHEVVADEHVVATGVLTEWEHPTAGRMRHPRLPVHFDGEPSPLVTGVPRLGEHTSEVLAGLAGRSPDPTPKEATRA